MESIGTYGTLYVVSAVLGFGYMAFAMALGQLHEAGHDTGFGDGGGHGAGHDFGGHDAGHDFGGDGGSHDFGDGGHDAGGADAGHDAGGADAGHAEGSGTGHDAVTQQAAQLTKVTGVHSPVRTQVHWTMRVMSIVSPMSMSLFLAFFGLVGMAIYKLGPISLIPAIAAGVIMRQVGQYALRTFVRASHVSTASKVEDAIGHSAEVSVSIQPGRTGEITYVLGSKRYNMPAKSQQEESEFKRGAKVLICDIKNGVVFVEPWTELTI